jgi:N-methylhydantoinase A/oxoprolinase/acetone carboxylase beta subunit
VEDFCRAVLESVLDGVEEALVEHLLRCELGHDMAGLIRRRKELRLLRLDIRPAVPVVALGAAAPALLAGLAERLGTEIVFPEEYAVGNACGAALVAARAARNIKEGA